MSMKGIQKGASRVPQMFRQKFNIGEVTKDAVYVDAQRRFQELEHETQKLHEESKKYFDAINGMLNHQIEFSKAIAEIYKPISGRMSDPNSIVPEGNPDGIAACEQYESVVRELQALLKPELEMIESRVIGPAVELLAVIKSVSKLLTKRDHKQLDFDRHRQSLKKLQDKKDKTLKDEKALYKAEADVEQATQEFEYFNDLLKVELPQLFALEREFILPLFQSFYYMQLNVFYTLHEHMQSMDIPYFNLQLNIEDAFQEKRGNIQEEAEKLAICHYKTAGGRRPGEGRLGPKYGAKPALEAGKKPLAIESGMSRMSMDSTYSTPPAYAASTSNGAVVPYSTGGIGKAKPPPPKPKPLRLGAATHVETCTALYDYEAQAAGDLSFTAGEQIEIIQKTPNENEWWTGRCNGSEGQFPGNYVQMN